MIFKNNQERAPHRTC